MSFLETIKTLVRMHRDNELVAVIDFINMSREKRVNISAQLNSLEQECGSARQRLGNVVNKTMQKNLNLSKKYDASESACGV